MALPWGVAGEHRHFISLQQLGNVWPVSRRETPKAAKGPAEARSKDEPNQSACGGQGLTTVFQAGKVSKPTELSMITQSLSLITELSMITTKLSYQ